MIGPIHPGVTLREDFMEPYGLSANSLAKALGIPQNRVSDIVRGRRGITADTALRLERAFGVSAAFWLNLQAQYELEVAKQETGTIIRKTVKDSPEPREHAEMQDPARGPAAPPA